MNNKYANIIVNISHEKLDKTFQYRIPDELINEIRPGVRVEIPFGQGGRLIKGYVVEITSQAAIEESKIKNIYNVDYSSTEITSHLIELAAWIRKNYGSTMNHALKTVIPIKQKVKKSRKKWVTLELAQEEMKYLFQKYEKSKKYLSRYRVLKELESGETIEYDLLRLKLGVSSSVLDTMEKNGLISSISENVFRNPYSCVSQEDRKIELNFEQQNIVNSIIKSKDSGDFKPHLIFGITGSGKTEIYIELIKKVIAENKQAIILIPEISLVYQTLKRFYCVFGEKVSVINSRMSQGEKFDQFERAVNGEVQVMIGPRSALFTPFPNLGIIIIDEEQEGAYKSETLPKYHARETAIQRALMTDSLIVLGSATPSVESYYKAKNDEYHLHILSKRPGESVLPKVHVVDLREELKRGNRTIFSSVLHQMITERLKKKEQIMLFINRRGFSGFLSCRSCGFAFRCPNCDVGMTLHNNGNLICHYCGHKVVAPKICPECGSKHMAAFGTGTQKIETLVQQMYPTAKVLRMDMDTTSKKGDFNNILSQFAKKEADILVGTQMIVKGHDFPNVTLVGIMAADLSLFASDYKASERTFQLITQAAGRAGRGEAAGDVVVQTYNTEHYSIQASTRQNFEEFYNHEILYRKLMGYPPLMNMVAVLVLGTEKEKIEDAVHKISVIIDEKYPQLIKIGPADAMIGKINNVFRKVIYLKSKKNEELINIKEIIEEKIEKNQEYYKNIIIQFDFSPNGSI